MINFQEMIAKLSQFWVKQGCILHQGYDLEVGAGTFNPATFLRSLGPEPYSAVYVEPSRRPQDGRYGENPNRVQFYHQMQVILKPSPTEIQDLYLQSLKAIGLDLSQHDIRFVHDDWENPTIGAWGLGWEVWADGMEVSQFTYFQAVGGLPVKPVSGEITYGLERLAMYIQNVDSLFDLQWNDTLTYGDIYKRSEWEWSHYNFTNANTKMWFAHFEDFEAEAFHLIQAHLPIPAYDFVMKASHAFNILDARGVISVTERTNYISRIRNLSKQLAESYIKSRESQKFPLLANKKELQAPLESQPPKAFDPTEKQDFLLEIGSEELPATFVPLGVKSLENHMRQLLKTHSIPFKTLQTFGTPRRLTILIQGLQAGTSSKTTERKGPSIEAAFDTEGIPSKAGQGFFRSLNLNVNSLSEIEKGAIPQLEIRTIKAIRYLFATLEQAGTSTRHLLTQELPKLITALDFPKKMRWSDLEIEYARPLRWIISLYGEEVIPFSLGHILSSNYSYGHRQLHDKKVIISHPKEYVDALRKASIMVDIQEREESILEQLSKIEHALKGQALAKKRVLVQVLHLVEWPFLTAGHFDPRFLQVPQEVAISEMVEHQKYFPLAAEKLLPHFIIVCNVPPTDLIRAGNQKALSSRLADGMFLYEEDLKIPLDRFNEKLKKMIFQKELGSVWEKVERISILVENLHSHLPLCDLHLAERAATLCKADLATGLVGEFPELQGTIGKLYALKHGENPAVAQAIDEHWMPRGEKAPLPQSTVGILLCLAEKIDNFLSCYSIGLKPTSSSDPYALRRQAIGLLKILIENKLHLPLPEMLKQASTRFSKFDKAAVQPILDYFTSRLRTIFLEYNFEKDEIEAVLSHQLDDAYALYKKLEALHSFRREQPKAFAQLLEIHTRTRKILANQKFTPKGVIPTLFQESVETNLFQKIESIKQSFHTQLLDRRDPKSHQWKEAISLLVELHEPITALFDQVKIVSEDAAIRDNRFCLIQEIQNLFEPLADFSKIQEL
ncbi:MAG: hypothetical protein S4CHLAM123_04970 [Chlamydiales bacterium]|nr:hypothetical protein [Chlamydiales bacterium]